jgi:aminoglycoside phosphotransferase (APT) family kinase protein
VGTLTEGSVTVRRVTGGFNNALYRVEADGQCYACKLCVADKCRRAAREYAALRLLHEAGLDIAPRPLWLDGSCTIVPFPAVAYRWLDGEPLSSSPTMQQLASLLDSFQRLHALQPSDFEDSDVPDAWAHWFDFELYLAELRGFLAKYGSWLAATDPDGQDLRDRLARLVDDCAEFITTAAVNPSRESVPLRLCRVDPNLANAIWSGDSRLRWVDWEFSGWGDPALDLAELRWHAASAKLSEAQHAWLRDSYRRPADDHTFEERLAVWDRLRATRWPFLILRWLWSEHHGPDRVRLTRPVADPDELRARLVRFIERAEHFASGGR